MGHCLFMRKGETHTAPISGILLSDIAEGSIVKLNENGSPAEFYVACHNYESSLNGEGRTLLVRKDCYDERAWHNSAVNAYATSDIDAWLNGDYKALFDADAQTAIGKTKFYYTIGNGDTTVTTMERAIFMLSVTELGKTSSYANTEGSALPISSTLLIAYLNGTAVDYWTRSPRFSSPTTVCYSTNGGGTSVLNPTSSKGSRPIFTLPSNALFDKTTMLLKGVA